MAHRARRAPIAPIVLLALFAALGPSAARAADVALHVEPGAGAGLSPGRTLAPVALRGYGTVSGRTWAGADGSILEIACESPGKAQLTLAKYVSDLHVLPGVDDGEIKPGARCWGGSTLALHEVKNAGAIVAARVAERVLIVAAPDRARLEKLLDGAFAGAAPGLVSKAEVEVPMWLDRWDRHGFRFYYAPLALPPPERMPKGQEPQSYDMRQDFAFAKDVGKPGLLMWATLWTGGSGEGITNVNMNTWVETLAKPLGLPIGINLSAYTYDMPQWAVNRFRADLSEPMPGYLGDGMSVAGWRGIGRIGEAAWGDTPLLDAELGNLQQVVKRFAKEPNVTTWLEPHGEFYQAGDLWMGYGPGNDATWRAWCRAKYKDVKALSTAWAEKIASFDTLRAPEVAEFAGLDATALDLAGEWQIENNDAPPDEWFTPAFDDSAWAAMIAPGDDHAYFRQKKKAVYRRTFDLPAKRFPAGQRVWLGLWDLNVAWDQPVTAWINGTKIAESKCEGPFPHWMRVEATAALKPGKNQISLCLPSGYLGYRIYLTRAEPKQYPGFSPGLNAKWADWVDWREDARIAAARRGCEMIREVDHERQIDFMAPGPSASGIKTLAIQYGGNFKDTGFMSGLWADLLPSLMRGSRLPFSLEPGGPPGNVPDYRRFLGRWWSEGNQGVDYFSHIGCVEWDPAIRAAFTETLPLVHAIGTCHPHDADLALLWDFRTDRLIGYPWGADLSVNIRTGWDNRQVFEVLSGSHPRDAITESDFANGEAARYKVVLDMSTPIMTDEMIAGIEKYVRDGGTFITLGQTGRHSPSHPESWPIAKLTGYETLSEERFPADGPRATPNQTASPAPGQDVWKEHEPWMDSRYITGLRLKRTASDAQDLLLWKDGTVAVGRRKLGKGWIVECGVKVNGPSVSIMTEMVAPLLDCAGVRRHRGEVEQQCADDAKANPEGFFTRYASNNGLFDLWSVWNQSDRHPLNATLVVKADAPARAYDLRGDKPVAMNGGRSETVTIPPLETCVLLTPTARIADAPLAWFELQRGWWRGTTPISRGFPAPSERFHRTLSDGWRWRTSTDQDQVASWAAAGFDDSAWGKADLGIVAPEKAEVHQVAMRRIFTVPAEWKSGRVFMTIRAATYPDFTTVGRAWLDGQPILGWGGEAGDWLGEGKLAPGEHVVLLEMKSASALVGLPGDCWITCIPDPERKIDLAGTWAAGDDVFHAPNQVTLPGHYKARMMKRTLTMPKDAAGKTAVLSIVSDRAFHAFVNGTLIEFAGGPIKGGVQLNITPFLHPGDNDLEILSHYGEGEIWSISVGLYDPKSGYP